MYIITRSHPMQVCVLWVNVVSNHLYLILLVLAGWWYHGCNCSATYGRLFDNVLGL